ncbi:MAG: CRISPR-associated endonuclease Cas1, partial [Acidobacteriota bacterium]
MTQGTYVGVKGETLYIRIEGETKLRVPIHVIGSVVAFGRITCSPATLGLCAERQVSVVFLSEHGRFLCRVEGPTSGNVLLRREQYRQSDEASSTATLARAMVLGKLANCRTVVLRAAREVSSSRPQLQEAASRL